MYTNIIKHTLRQFQAYYLKKKILHDEIFEYTSPKANVLNNLSANDSSILGQKHSILLSIYCH